MHTLAGILGAILVLAVLWDSFETIVLPRRVTRRLRLTRAFYRATWVPWRAIARRVRSGSFREAFLSFFGPLSLLVLLALWALILVTAFGVMQWALGSQETTRAGKPDLWMDVYFSGTTFFTLGLGDLTPNGFWPRVLTVLESGLGFGFLAMIIGYLPALAQAFGQREINVSLLDERAGSPPSALELIRRHRDGGDEEEVGRFLAEWERWSAELLESHLSYPVLGYFRSQHENQSWLAAMTMILDACAVIISTKEGRLARQARLTFAMARHAAADLSQIYGTSPKSAPERPLPAGHSGPDANDTGPEAVLAHSPEAKKRLESLRAMYEPFVSALAVYLLMPLPPWKPMPDAHDAWVTTAWGTEQNLEGL